MDLPVYLDYAATTPVDPQVLESMQPYLTRDFGNASSVHSIGRRARGAVEDCRDRVAAVLGAQASEIVFTSGGTESNNLALAGVAGQEHAVVTSRAEHESVLESVLRHSLYGGEVGFVPVSADGRVPPDDLRRELTAVRSPQALVSLMHVNNEIGAINDIAVLSRVAHENDAVFHTDAVQSAGLLDIDVNVLGVDLMTVSGHKVYGPKGTGVLFVRSGIPFDGLIKGGHQERQRRAGTENVAGIVGLARALELAAEDKGRRADGIARLRDRLARKLGEQLGALIVFNSGSESSRSAPHIVNVSVRSAGSRRVDGEMLLLGLDIEGVCASSGSACSSGAVQPSHVLTALGRPAELAGAAVRFSLGKDTTADDVDYAVVCLGKVIERMGLTEPGKVADG